MDKLWRHVKYGMKRLWDRRKRWLRERLDFMMPVSDTERMLLHPCVAHRGWSSRAPENTLAAFRMALREPAVQWMELDVHLSKDEIPVVIHDPTLKRTTGRKGRVSDFTASELAQMDAGSWFHPSFASEGIPALDQVLGMAVGRCQLNVEIKGEGTAANLIARKVLEAVVSRRMEHDVVITSFRPEVLYAVRALRSEIRTGLIIDGQPPGLIRNAQELGASFLSIGYRHLTAALLKEAEEAEMNVMAWTVNASADLRRLAERPESIMVCTDYPDRWLAAMGSPKQADNG